MRSYTAELTPLAAIDTPIPSGAGFGVRFLARLIDLIYMYLLGLITGFISGILFAILSAMGRISENWAEVFTQGQGNTFGIGILCAFLYHTVADGVGGVTLGKLICGLRVVQLDGRSCTMLGAFKRDLAFHLDGLFFGLVGYTAMKESVLRQRYGDKWGQTVVVKHSVFAPNPGRPVWRMVAGLVLGTLIWMGVIFTDLLLKVL